MSDDRTYDDRHDEDTDEDLGTRGNKDTMKGKLNQAAGNVQEKAGDLTNNEDLRAKGKEKQLKGDVQEGAGKVERGVDDALDG